MEALSSISGALWGMPMTNEEMEAKVVEWNALDDVPPTCHICGFFSILSFFSSVYSFFPLNLYP